MAKKDVFKLEPTELNLKFFTPGTSSGTWYIDIARALSAVNRRFYRQGYQYAVADIQFLSTSTGTVQLGRLPTTWTVSNAWMKVMSSWDRQQKEALADASGQSAKAKYRDFKIAANAQHFDNWNLTTDATPGLVLPPFDETTNQYGGGEWQPSLVVVPHAGGTIGNLQEYGLHMVGADNAAPGQSKGMIKAYQQSRARPNSSQPADQDPQDSILSDMFDDGLADDAAVGNATDRNDDAPYDVINYPGGDTNGPGLVVHDYVNIVQQSAPGGAGIQTAYARGGAFPCGLMSVTWTPDSAANLVMIVRLVPGTYRGVHAEHMKEM
jgi:hypothetical protein